MWFLGKKLFKNFEFLFLKSEFGFPSMNFQLSVSRLQSLNSFLCSKFSTAKHFNALKSHLLWRRKLFEPLQVLPHFHFVHTLDAFLLPFPPLLLYGRHPKRYKNKHVVAFVKSITQSTTTARTMYSNTY